MLALSLLRLLILSSLPEHVLLSAIENTDTIMLKKVNDAGERLAENMALDLASSFKGWRSCYAPED
ncbi:MAG: hypothetical protein VX737_06545 [Pseudomonadota bacterium]|nr:hypothetical protein [Pseudomonadota bacterium]